MQYTEIDLDALPDQLAQRVLAATSLLAQLDCINKKSPHYQLGLNILEAVWCHMIPDTIENNKVELLSLKGGKTL